MNTFARGYPRHRLVSSPHPPQPSGRSSSVTDSISGVGGLGTLLISPIHTYPFRPNASRPPTIPPSPSQHHHHTHPPLLHIGLVGGDQGTESHLLPHTAALLSLSRGFCVRAWDRSHGKSRRGEKEASTQICGHWQEAPVIEGGADKIPFARISCGTIQWPGQRHCCR